MDLEMQESDLQKLIQQSRIENMRYWLLLVFLVFLPVGLFAQQEEAVDSTELVEADAEEIYFEEKYGDEGYEEFAAADTTSASFRSSDSSRLGELKASDELNYKQPPAQVMSLWEQFLFWLEQLFSQIIKGAIDTQWGSVFTWIGVIVVIALIIFWLLKVDAFKLIYKSQTAEVDHGIVENIHEMDFDKLIAEARSAGNYRLAVRLVFLQSLKILADRKFIVWEQGKTNHEYLVEMKVPELKPGFESLNYYFEYAWYGDFKITSDLFERVATDFATWRRRAEV